ncbi:MAG: oligosaccharide flippase family protein [Candidatus Lokiarchaeia archaeon]
MSFSKTQDRVSQKDFLITLATNIFIQACAVATGIIAARLLLPEGRGELAAVLLWPTIFAAIGIYGTNWVITREIGQDRSREPDLARASVILGLVLGIIGMAVGYYLIPLLLPADKAHLIWQTRLFLLLLPLNYTAFNLLGLDQGGLRFKRYNWTRAFFYIPYLSMLISFYLLKKASVLWFVIANLIGWLTLALVRLIIYRKLIRAGKPDLGLYKRILARGHGFTGAAIAMQSALRLDQIILVSFLGSAQLGFYVVALAFSSAHASLGNALNIVTFASTAQKQNRKTAGEFLARTFRRSILLYMLASGGVAALSPILIVPFFGSEFAPAIVPCSILAIFTGLSSLAKILDEALRGAGLPVPGIWSKVWSSLTLILLAWVLIPGYGITGMACAAVGNGLMQVIYLSRKAQIHFGISWLDLWGIRLSTAKDLLNMAYKIPAVLSRQQ